VHHRSFSHPTVHQLSLLLSKWASAVSAISPCVWWTVKKFHDRETDPNFFFVPLHFILSFLLEQLMLSDILRRNHLQAADSFWLNQLITLHKCNLVMLACNVAVIHCDSKVLLF
jgi:hypothetical protein